MFALIGIFICLGLCLVEVLVDRKWVRVIVVIGSVLGAALVGNHIGLSVGRSLAVSSDTRTVLFLLEEIEETNKKEGAKSAMEKLAKIREYLPGALSKSQDLSNLYKMLSTESETDRISTLKDE